MKNHKAYKLVYAFLATIFVAGCSNNGAVPPLPTSEKAV